MKRLILMMLLLSASIFANETIKKYEKGYLRFEIPKDRDGIGTWYRCCDDYFDGMIYARLVYVNGELVTIITDLELIDIKNGKPTSISCFEMNITVDLTSNDEKSTKELGCTFSLIPTAFVIDKIK